MRYTQIKARHLTPPHKASADILLASMTRDGWIGRPLLARVLGDGWQALTGSHRIATAKLLGLTVPVLLIDDSDLTAEGWDAMDACTDDDDLLVVLRDYGLDAAWSLLAQEPNL